MRLKQSLWLLLSLLPCALPAQGLQWHRNPGNDHMYALVPNTTWQLAEVFAVGQGGHLVTIRNQAENDWILATFAPLAGTAMWIGLNDLATEGAFVWSRGEPVAYTSWDFGQPNDTTGGDDTVVMYPGIGNWDDLFERVRPAIIEVFNRPTSQPFGTGCPNGALVPAIVAAPGSVPVLSGTFTLELTSLPTTMFSKVHGLVGFSKTSWAGFTLPQDLAFVGAPGCTQYIGIEASVLIPHSGGTATWDIPIPNDKNLSGVEFFLQALVIDPLGSTFYSVSNAIEGTIGIR